MNAPDQIPLALLRDLAARLPAPMMAGEFVELVEYVATRPVPGSTPHPAPAVAPAPAVQAAPVPIAKPAMPERRGEDWTQEEKDTARTLLSSGGGIADVAFALKRPIEATRTAVKRFKLRDPNASPAGRYGGWTDAQVDKVRELRRAGASLSDMAEAVGRTPDACRMQIKRLRDKGEDLEPATAPYTPAEDARLLRERDKGTPYAALGRQMGRSGSSLENRHALLRAKAAEAAAMSALHYVAPAPKASAGAIKDPQVDAVDYVRPAAKPAPKPAARPITTAAAPPGVALFRAAAQRDQLPTRQVDILEHALAAGPGFDAATDLRICEGLIARTAPADLAAELGTTAAALLARFKVLRAAPGLADARGIISIDGQADLLRALRWMAGQGGQANGG